MSKALNDTGRPFIYSCSWPAYQGGLPPEVNYTLLGQICNLWRNYGDIQDSWDDVVDIATWWGDHADVLVPAAGPGISNVFSRNSHFSPHTVGIGNFKSYDNHSKLASFKPFCDHLSSSEFY